VEQMKTYREAGIRGFTMESHLRPAVQQYLLLWDQLELHVLSQLVDDPEKDGNKLIDEFFERY